MKTSRNHLYNKLALTGFVGGLLLMALLYYPVLIVLPGEYIRDWQGGDASIGLLLVGAAGLLPALIGYLAVRWSGSDWWGGALAGGFSGVVAHGGIGAAAAGVTANAQQLLYGMNPAHDEAHFMELIVNSVLDTVIWTGALFPLLIVGGALVGAIGGSLAPSPETDSGEPPLKLLLTATLTSITADINLIVVLVVYALLPGAVADAAAEAGIFLSSAQTEAIQLLPSMMGLVMYLLSLLWLYLIIRRALLVHHLRLRLHLATILSMGAVLLIGTTLLVYGIRSVTGIIVLAGLVLSLLIVLSLLRLMWRSYREGDSAQEPLELWRQFAGSFKTTLLATVAGMGTVMLSHIGIALNLVLITVVMIVPWIQYDETITATGTTSTLPEVVLTLYSTHAGSMLMLFGAILVFLVLSALVLWGVNRGGGYVLARRRAAQLQPVAA